jgi:hypothetical protein
VASAVVVVVSCPEEVAQDYKFESMVNPGKARWYDDRAKDIFN